MLSSWMVWRRCNARSLARAVIAALPVTRQSREIGNITVPSAGACVRDGDLYLILGGTLSLGFSRVIVGGSSG